MRYNTPAYFGILSIENFAIQTLQFILALLLLLCAVPVAGFARLCFFCVSAIVLLQLLHEDATAYFLSCVFCFCFCFLLCECVCVCLSERACTCLCGLWMCVVAGVTVKRGRQQRQRRTTWESVVANIAISLTRTLLWHSVDKLPMFDSLFLPLWWITAHAGVGEALCLAPHRGARPNIHAHTHTHTQAHARTHMHMLHTLQIRPGRQQQQPTVYQNK